MGQKISFILSFLLFFMIAKAQQKGILQGKVTDTAGTPLVRASIYVHGANTGAITNEMGFYKTESIKPGKYLVEVSYTGYETVVQTIDIRDAREQNFVLLPAVIEQEGVTVTGVSAATRLRQIPQPVAIVKKEDLEKLTSTNIINSLAHIPGVTALTTGPAISKPFIRGLGYNRVVTINDGVRQEGQQWGDEHGIEIDDYSAQRVEVLKGPASLMYGSDALAGVINIQTLMPAPEGVIKTNVLSEYQTNDRLRGFYGNVAGTKNGFSFNVYGSYKGAADYKNKYDGYVFNSKFYNQNFGGMVGYRGSWGHSYLNITNFNQHLGIVEGDRDEYTGEFVKPVAGGATAIVTENDFTQIKPEVPYQHVQHLKITSDNSFNVGNSKLDLLVAYQHNQRQEFGNPDAYNTPGAWFDLKTVDYAAKFNFPYRANWRTSTGVTGMVQQNVNKAEEVLIPDYSLFDIGAFVFTQYSRNKLTLSGGLRIDNRHINSHQMMDGTDVKFAAFSRDFSNISGSAGLSYAVAKDFTLKFNIARGFRAPSLAELASNGAHEGTNRFEIGDKDLKSETSFQADGGVELNTEHITLGTSIFYNAIQHFIFYRKLQAHNGADSVITDPDTGNDLMVFQFSEQTAHLYGLEFNMDIHPHPLDWLHFENTVSYTRAMFLTAVDGSRNVPFIPAVRYLADIKGNFFTKGKKIRNVYVSVESDYTFKQNHPFTGFNTETATGDYWLVNASAGADVVHKGRTIFSIHVSAMNLGDVAYQNHLSRLKYTAVNNVTGRQGVFDMGRNFGCKIVVPLEFAWK